MHNPKIKIHNDKRERSITINGVEVHSSLVDQENFKKTPSSEKDSKDTRQFYSNFPLIQ